MRYLFLVFLFCTASVSAATIIQNLNFTGPGIFKNDQSTFILPGTARATMSFDLVSPYNEAIIKIGIYAYPISAGGCTLQRRCSLPIDLNVPAAATAFTASFNISANNGADQQTNLRYQFSMDNRQPTLLGFGTPTCIPAVGATCSVKTGENTIIAYFQEEDSGMAAPNVYLLDDRGNTFLADECHDNKCSFAYSVPSDTNQFSVRLLDTTKDIAGNRVEQSSNTPTPFFIDNQAPLFTGIIIQQLEQLATAPNIINGPFEARITFEDESPVMASFDITQFLDPETPGPRLVNVSCTNICSLRITPTRVGTYQNAELRYTLTDSAGNQIMNTSSYLVAMTTSEGGEFWQVNTNAYPSTIDKASLKFFSKYISLPIHLTGSSGATPVYTDVRDGSCKFSSNANVIRLPISAEMQGKSTPTPVLMVTIRDTEELDEISGILKLECTIDITTMNNDRVYLRPEEENITARIRLTESELLPQRIASLTQTAQEDIDSTTQTLQTIRTVMDVAVGACTVVSVVRAAEAGVTTAQTLTATVPAIGTAIGTALSRSDQTLNKVSTVITKTKVLGPICLAVNCVGTQKANDLLYDTKYLGAAASFSSQFALGTEKYKFMDPYKSWVVASTTGCLPAIAYHYENLQGINCVYNGCLAVDVAQGLPVSQCQAQKQFYTCRFIAGGVYYAFPPAAIYQAVRTTALSIANNPIAAGGYVFMAACYVIPEPLGEGLCKLPFKIMNSLKAYNDIRSAIASVATVVSNQETVCEMNQRRIDEFRYDLSTSCKGNLCCIDGDCLLPDGNFYRISNGTARAQQEYNNELQRIQQDLQSQATRKQAEIAVLEKRKTALEQEFETNKNRYDTSGECISGDNRRFDFFCRNYQGNQDRITNDITLTITPDLTAKRGELTVIRAIVPTVPTSVTEEFSMLTGSTAEKINATSVVNRQQLCEDAARARLPGCAGSPTGLFSGAFAGQYNTIVNQYRTDISQQTATRGRLTEEAIDVQKAGQQIPSYNSFRSTMTTEEYFALANLPCVGNAGCSDPLSASATGAYRDAVRARMADNSAITSSLTPAQLADFNHRMDGADTPRKIEQARNRALSQANSNANKKAQQAARNLTRTENAMKKKLNDLALDQTFDRFRNDRGFAFTSAMSFSLQLSGLTQGLGQVMSLFGHGMPNWLSKAGFGDGLGLFDSELAQKTDLEQVALNKFCNGNIKRATNSAGFSGNSRSGLYLQATTDSVLSEEIDVEQLNTYLIGGRLSLPADMQAVNYTIYLKAGSGQSESLHDGSGTNSWADEAILHLETTTAYTQACITFDRNIDELFPVTSVIDSPDFCVPIVRAES